MPQILLDGMIIKSSFRNIEFVKGDINSVEYDSNYSIITVTYKPGTYNTELTYPFVRVYDKRLVTSEGKFIMDYHDVTINGIKYYEMKHNQNITQCIVNDDIENQIVCRQGLGVLVLLNKKSIDPESSERLTVDSYLELFNKNNSIMYAEKVGDFTIANIPPIDFQRNHKQYIFRNVFPFTNDVIFTDEVIIEDGFLDYMHEQYPQYHFRNRPTSFNDADLEKERKEFVPNSTIYYKFSLAPEYHPFGNRPLIADEYDTYRQAVMSVELEYTTDDLNTLMKFREDYIMQREFSNKRNYKFKDTAGKTWDASVYWDISTGEEVPNPPTLMPEISKLALQAFRMKANIIGTICRYKLKVCKIVEAVVNEIITNSGQKINIGDYHDKHGS